MSDINGIVEGFYYFSLAMSNSTEIYKDSKKIKNLIKLQENEIISINKLLSSLSVFADSFEDTTDTIKIDLIQKVLQYQSLEKMLNTKTIKLDGLKKVEFKKIKKDSNITYEWEKTFDEITSKITDKYLKNIWSDILKFKVEGKDITKQTLSVIEQMDRESIELYNQFASRRTGEIIINEKNALQTVYSLNLNQIMRFQDLGLVRPVAMSIETFETKNKMHGHNFELIDGNILCISNHKTTFQCYYLTKAGAEILNIIRGEISKIFKTNLIIFLKQSGFVSIVYSNENTREFWQRLGE